MCKDYGDIIYLDVASSVTVDGVLPADAMAGLHPTECIYKEVNARIEIFGSS